MPARTTLADAREHLTADSLLGALMDARAVELELLEGLTDAQMRGVRAHFLEPPIWEICAVAAGPRARA